MDVIALDTETKNPQCLRTAGFSLPTQASNAINSTAFSALLAMT
jgi:hypothetical protein